MALIVEDGSNIANAEAYATVAYVSSYWSKRGKEDAWDAIEDQEAAIRLATDYITTVYGTRWAGARTYETQALDWPREYVLVLGSKSTQYRASDVIPVELKNATAELALKTASGDLLSDLGRETLSETVDVISVTYAEGSGRQTKYAAADAWLDVLLGYGGSTIPIRRA